jgi:hypothetical protein
LTCVNAQIVLWEAKMKLSIALAALLITGFVTASTEKASAVVYCQYVNYPVGCVAKAGVVLRPRPVGRAVAREAVRPGTPGNRGGPVNRAGRR